MRFQQACTLIEKEIKPLWPDWKINDAQLKVWISQIIPFDYSTVKQAAHRHFASEKGIYPRPQLPAIIAEVRLYQPVT
jgi:hypothetical protein